MKKGASDPRKSWRKIQKNGNTGSLYHDRFLYLAIVCFYQPGKDPGWI